MTQLSTVFQQAPSAQTKAIPPAAVTSPSHATRNAEGYVLIDGRPLGVLPWGHPHLVQYGGPQYASMEAWAAWYEQVGREAL